MRKYKPPRPQPQYHILELDESGTFALEEVQIELDPYLNPSANIVVTAAQTVRLQHVMGTAFYLIPDEDFQKIC